MDFYIIRCNDGLCRIGVKGVRKWDSLNHGQVITMLEAEYSLFDGTKIVNSFVNLETALAAVKQLRGENTETE